MTGGQRNEGGLSVLQIAQQVAAEGAKAIRVVTDEPWKYPKNTPWPADLTVHHRDELMPVQKDLSAISGLTVLIYDQTCAAEKRRRRKRGQFPDPAKRVLIHDLVCEGCGDCGVKSNCVSIQPLETEFGRKRRIDQSSCNKDYSCVKGFCPSFVTVHGPELRKPDAIREDDWRPATSIRSPQREDKQEPLPDPILPALGRTYDIIITGVGGTGIVTIGGVLGMAAHLEGKGVGIIDMAGLAQKGGAVYSHMRIAERVEDIHAIRIAAGGADLVLGGDMVVVGNKKVLSAVKNGATRMMVNTTEFLPGDFTRNADFSLPRERLRRAISAAAGAEQCRFIDATKLAVALLGNSIGANIFLVGYAYQLGALPLSAASIEEAITLNGEAVAMNQAAFRWGRRAALDLASVEALIEPATPVSSDGAESLRLSETLDETIARRVTFLTRYQNADYGDRYRARVNEVQRVEATKTPGETALSEAVARYLFKLMAYKDEYEVARLWSEEFPQQALDAQFSGEKLKLNYHLAPPFLARKDKTTGEPRKITFGPWIGHVFAVLAKFRFLRGTALDPFGYAQERKLERALIADYEHLLDELLVGLAPANHATAVALASIPEKIRGFGHVKARHLKAAKAEEAVLLEQFRAGPMPILKAAE
jgi:indolepyruvate ferredoxin oxidoreductase